MADIDIVSSCCSSSPSPPSSSPLHQHEFGVVIDDELSDTATKEMHEETKLPERDSKLVLLPYFILFFFNQRKLKLIRKKLNFAELEFLEFVHLC